MKSSKPQLSIDRSFSKKPKSKSKKNRKNRKNKSKKNKRKNRSRFDHFPRSKDKKTKINRKTKKNGKKKSIRKSKRSSVIPATYFTTLHAFPSSTVSPAFRFPTITPFVLSKKQFAMIVEHYKKVVKKRLEKKKSLITSTSKSLFTTTEKMAIFSINTSSTSDYNFNYFARPHLDGLKKQGMEEYLMRLKNKKGRDMTMTARTVDKTSTFTLIFFCLILRIK